jgi:predicted Zn-dependent protease
MKLWFLIPLLCWPWRVASDELPNMGSSADSLISQTQEKEIGEAVLRRLRQQNETLDDLEVDNYLNSLGYKLVSNSNNPTFPFTFFALKDKQINAFATVGGFIGVNAGLILHTRSESELAAVMAHEISHVTQRHINRTVEAMSNLSVPMMAALLAAVAVASKDVAVGQAAAATVMASAVQMQINFTRSHEKEADRVGMEVLAQSGFDPHSMPDFFQELQDNSRYAGAVPEFLRSHPLTTDRIAESKSLADRHPKIMAHDSAQYQLVRAKVLIKTTDNLAHQIKALNNSLQTGKFRDERAVRYALVLALLDSGQTDGVQGHLDWLQQNDGDRVVYYLAQARLKLLTKELESAKSIYQHALSLYPNDSLLSMAYSQLLVQEQQPAKALAILLQLKPYVQSYQQPDFYWLLAKAQQGAGQQGEAHGALASHYQLKGQTKTAIEQLEQGLALPDLDFYLKSKLEAQLQQMQELLAQEQESDEKEENFQSR